MSRRQRSTARRFRRARSARSSSSSSRKPLFETLEERRLLAVATVTNDNDLVNGDVTSIVALTTLGNDGGDGISLREAITAANADAAPDNIDFAAALNGMQILLVNGELTITESLTIDASSLPAGLAIQADDPSAAAGDGTRIFNVDDGNGDPDKAVTLVGLTLTGGDVSGNGGAILNFESLQVIACTIQGNAAQGDGGGISSDSANLTVDGSTVANNSASNGGGIFSFTDSDFVTTVTHISDSTISGNDASNRGGGVYNHNGLTAIAHSTITLNTAPADNGSGVGSFGDTLTRTEVTHTIIADNANSDVDYVTEATNSFVSNDYNLIGTGNATGAFSGAGDQLGADPLLGPLADNGGPTWTHALAASSPAVDAGDPAFIAPPDFDQRGSGFPRVVDGDGDFVDTIDVGAYEFEPIVAPVPIGSAPYIFRDDSITPFDDDEDIFLYRAHDSGKLAVRVYFVHDFGNIDLQVLDQNGNVLGSSSMSSSTVDLEEVIIPVVYQEPYFIRVYGVGGFGEFGSNAYGLEVENFPAPVPTGVVLDPDDDTGMSNSDNVTSDTTPQLFIQTDVLNFVDTNNNGTFDDPDKAPTPASVDPPTDDWIDALTPANVAAILAGTPGNDHDGGISVEVTLVNTTTGASVTGIAEAFVPSVADPNLPEVYRFTPSAPLTAGVYMVTARTKVFDGQEDDSAAPDQQTGRSNASPPLWLTITTDAADPADVSADLLASSDTGMSNEDNVTNKMQPAFNGVAPVGSKVRMYVQGIEDPSRQLVGQTVTGSDSSEVGIGGVAGVGGKADDGLGLWEITTEPLDDDAYDVTLEIEDAAGNVTTFDVDLDGDDATTIDLVVDTIAPNTPYLDLLDDSGRSDADDITNDSTPDVSMTSTDPNVALALMLYSDNFKFRIFDRFETEAQEVLIYNSAQDTDADDVTTAGDMFTALTQLTRMLPALTPANPAITGGALSDGVHNLKLEVEDRAGNISHDFLLSITVDTATPPVSFGLPDAASQIDGLAADSDTGVTTQPDTFSDRVTSDTTPRVWGRAEADTIVRVYLDRDADGAIDLTTDTFLGQTVAVPYDGNDAYPDGYWELTSTLDLNQIVGLPKDGLRRLLVTSEDVAGNPPGTDDTITDGVDELQIFIDTQGPQISAVTVNNLTEAQYDLFDPKPSETGFTPLVDSLTISVRDLPNRLDQTGTLNDFLYEAIVKGIGESPGNYLLVGDHVGTIAIQSVVVTNAPRTSGNPATATVVLNFASPLPDDRYTLTVSDNLVDPAANMLDGESNADEPQETPTFPSGDGVPGGDFVARFTVDSRPEIGSFVAQAINIDINGNFVWDPAGGQIGNDTTNVDLSFTLPAFDGGTLIPGGLSVHDLLTVGRFTDPEADGLPDRLFDQLAAYGSYNGQFRWLIDFNSDGVVDTADGDLIQNQAAVANFNISGAIPVAGNFDGDDANGDEIGLYYSGKWAIDTNHDYVIDNVLSGNLLGHPIVGDFDGDGNDDFGVFNNNVLSFGFNLSPTTSATMTWGFPGVLDRPIAADMDQDGIDDIGLWVPRDSAQDGRIVAEWYFLVSNDRDGELRATGSVNTLNHGFSPTPLGADLYAEFGDEMALPIVGNFDPPVAASATEPGPGSVLPGDYDGNGSVDNADYDVWHASFGTTNSAADGNGDGVVDAGDYSIWRDNLGAAAASSASLTALAGGDTTTGETTSVVVEQAAPLAVVAEPAPVVQQVAAPAAVETSTLAVVSPAQALASSSPAASAPTVDNVSAATSPAATGTTAVSLPASDLVWEEVGGDSAAHVVAEPTVSAAIDQSDLLLLAADVADSGAPLDASDDATARADTQETSLELALAEDDAGLSPLATEKYTGNKFRLAALK